MTTDLQKKQFLNGYIECALWCNEFDNYQKDDISKNTMEKIIEDCEDFLLNNDLLKNLDYSQSGHDFFLTRNGHGSGFWDRGNENGEKLTELCIPYGSFELYINDDNFIDGE